jgi:hypothetical protein
MNLIYGSKKSLLIPAGHVEQNMYIFLPILDDIHLSYILVGLSHELIDMWLV